MNAAELRARQKPFKDQYKQHPEEALIKLRATGTIDPVSLTVQLNHQGPPLSRTGIHPLAGGDGAAACAAEMMLEALIGCAGVTFAAVVTAMDVPITSAELTATGLVDFRGTLAIAPDAPVGFQEIHIQFVIDSEAPDEKLEKVVELSEKYCVVAQTLKNVTAGWQRTP